MTYAEYLEAEAISEIRHEFLDGDVWAMSGGTPEHTYREVFEQLLRREDRT